MVRATLLILSSQAHPVRNILLCFILVFLLWSVTSPTALCFDLGRTISWISQTILIGAPFPGALVAVDFPMIEKRMTPRLCRYDSAVQGQTRLQVSWMIVLGCIFSFFSG